MNCKPETLRELLIDKLISIADKTALAQRFDGEDIPTIAEFILVKRYSKMLRYALQETESCSEPLRSNLIEKIYLYSIN